MRYFTSRFTSRKVTIKALSGECTKRSSLTKGYTYTRSMRIQEKEDKGEIHETEQKC